MGKKFEGRSWQGLILHCFVGYFGICFECEMLLMGTIGKLDIMESL